MRTGRGAASLLVALACTIVAAHGALSLARWGLTGMRGNRVFYDEFHVRRHFIDGENARGEWAYHHVSGYAELRRTLESLGYEVVVHREGRLRPGDLDAFDVVFVGEQSWQGTVMTDAEREVIRSFVRRGGGLWAVAEHTNAHDIGEHFNELVAPMGIRAEYDSICEDNGTRESRDWVAIRDFRPHPITRGLRAVYWYNGCSFDTPFGIAFSDRATWADDWNPLDRSRANRKVHNGNNVRDPGERSGPFVALAARTWGKGRVATTCDHNAFANPTLRHGSNRRLLVNAMAWLGRPRTNPDAYSLAAATGLLAALAWATRRFRLVPTAAFAFVVLAGAGATVGASSCARAASAPRRLLFADRLWGPSRVRSKDPEGFFGLFEHVGKDRGLRPWMLERIEPGYDVLVLPAPTEPLSAADLGVVDETLRAGRTVAWLATEESLRAPGGRQLAKRFGVEARLIPRPDSSSMGEARIHGTTRLHRGVSTLRLPPRVDLVRISARGSRVRLRLHAGESKGDFVTEIPSRGGRFVVVTPAEVFANANLHDRQTRLGMVDLVVQIFRWMTETR